MKLTLRGTTLLALLLWLAPGLARPESAWGDAPEQFVEFSLDVSKFDYAEDFEPPGKSTENGVLLGLLVSYRYQPSVTSNYFRLEFEASPSSTHYVGTTQGPDYLPVDQQTKNQFYRLESAYGWNFFCGLAETQPLCLSAYGGLGGRIWVRGDSTVIDGVGSPSEIYSWLYLPVGARLEQGLPGGWSVGLDASLRWTFSGHIVVKFSEISSTYEDAQGSLGSRLGFRIESPVQYRFSKLIRFQAVPWFEFSEIGEGSEFDIIQSGAQWGVGFEPASRTFQYGMRAGVVLDF